MTGALSTANEQGDHGAFGVPKGERGKWVEEYLTLVQRLSTEDRVSYTGPTHLDPTSTGSADANSIGGAQRASQ